MVSLQDNRCFRSGGGAAKMEVTEPKCETDDTGDQVWRLLERGSVVVITGAGLSTSSGIPDYRDREGNWKGAQPVSHQDFLRLESIRQRYWARSFLGWPTVARAAPGRGHRALVQLERAGRIDLIITQNVDGLHQKAGSAKLLELHGGLAAVICLSCRHRHPRAMVQDWLGEANPGLAGNSALAAPDGAARVAAELYAGFRVPDCPACGGMLKPDVVFFGDSVPKERVTSATAAIAAAAGLLVVGSSLMVYSGFRFVEFARREGKPVMAINLGTTRADHLLDAKVEQDCDVFLDDLRTRPMPKA
ncbi:MAG: NAD-dependent protein deacetylase [Betaproteobacteria bacterium]|nr:NAD-dependent protein deacetylase [Betaproteobacteria bacterium]